MFIKNFLRRWEIGPRGKIIVQTGSWSIVAKAAAAANLFLTIPFALQALGPEQFGAWATLVSFVTFSGFLDFGFGNGTMNLVAAARGRGASTEIGDILREGRRTLIWVSAWLTAVATIATPLVPWHRLLGLPETLANSSSVAAAAVLFTIALAVPLNLANRVQLGLGQGDKAFRWQAIGQILTLSIVIVLAKAHASLEALTAAAVITPLFGSVANTLLLWRDPLIITGPSEESKNQSISAHIRREGMLFFILQLAAALTFSADLPLISALRGPTEAGTYAIVQRLFSIVTLGLSLVWAPLWPIYRQALASRDHSWVVRTLRRAVLSAVVVASVGATVLALGFNHIVALWVRQPLKISSVLLAGFALWCIIDAAGTAIATFLNAASILRFQVVVGIVLAASSFCAKLLLLQTHDTELLPWITLMAYLCISLVPTMLFSKRLMQQALA